MRHVDPNNRTLTYSTGRDYGTAQVLEIEILNHKTDDFSFVTGSALFVDRSRHIAARVDFIAFGTSDDHIGRAVLAAYDSGDYYSKIFSHLAD
jgi:hypothetical protein